MRASFAQPPQTATGLPAGPDDCRSREPTGSPKCLHIAHVDGERGFGGGEVQVFLLMDGLARRGHRNLLFCPPRSRAAEEADRRGVETRCVRMRGDLDLRAVLVLAREFRRARVDLIHLHTGRATWLGGLAARAAGLPAIATRRMDRRIPRGWRSRLVYCRLVQQVVAISPAVAECLAAGAVPRDRTRVIYSAVDPALLRPSMPRHATRARLGAGPDDPVLLALASLVPCKGLDVFLDAIALLAGQGLWPLVWIAGEGPLQTALEAQARRLRLTGRVRFLGRRADVADLLAACDVFVMPSRREGLGIAALEAMAAARPVICSAIGGLSDAVVPGRTGLLVRPEDPGTLARAIGQVLRNGALCERLGAAGPGRVKEHFLAEQMVAAYDDLYQSVLHEWRSRYPGVSGDA